MSNICTSQLTFLGKPVDNLTQDELKQALVLTYEESNKYRNLYFKTILSLILITKFFISNGTE